ncbi:hypothetical protein Pcinc_010197 [Petrolisthes cinctipes]|uniref:PiggyBac transposable element-derived protein domain-containing protein n=1 Tax=Petrolisthes cinctipes TaxID=88211 RepID=A0AAE1KTW3_PETCI|nr:hypothetical protein Pcinc_010197 [Petrolisthes cinctipes]
MAREARVGNPPLKSIQDMKRKSERHGEYSYTTSDDGILAIWWKDNNILTVLSTDIGVNPATKCLRYSKETKRKEEVDCPSVIKSYNANMGGIDKSDMLVHLYKTPMKSKRWYMRFFAYCLDLCVCNAWLCYRRDYRGLGETGGLTLKNFRLQIYKSLSNQRPALPYRQPRSSTDTSPGDSTSTFQLPKAIRGHRSAIPNAPMRFDKILFHVPLHQTWQTCKHCSKKGHVIHSSLVCQVCKVHLCLNSERNCFVEYHEAVA